LSAKHQDVQASISPNGRDLVHMICPMTRKETEVLSFFLDTLVRLGERRKNREELDGSS
jgi:hypothetical protein